MTPSGARLRPARWTDLPAIIRLHSKCFQERYELWRYASFLVGSAYRCTVVELDDVFAAYMVTCPARYTSPPRRVLELTSLAVRPDHRRRGLGALLLQQAIARSQEQGFEQLYLQVAVSNEAALGLYRGAGFGIEQRLTGYYQNGEDAWLMVYPAPVAAA